MAGHRHGPGRIPEKPKNFKGTLRKLLHCLGEHRFALALVLVLALASTAFGIVGPKILSTATTELATGLGRKLSGLGGIDFGKIGKILLTVLALYLVSAACSFFQSWILAGVTQKLAYRLRGEISAKIHRMPLRYFERGTVGDVLSRITNDVDTMSSGMAQSVTQLVTNVTLLIGVLVMMLRISWLMTLIALIVLPVTGVLTSRIVKRSQRYFVAQQKNLGAINGKVEETYAGHSVVRAFNREAATQKEFDAINARLYRSAWKSQFLSGLMMPVTTFVSKLGYVCVVVLGGSLAARGTITIGDIQAFISYMASFTQPITQLAQISTQLQTMAAAAERVFDFLAEAEEPADPALPAPAEHIRGDVSFRHVRFGYDPEQPVIRDWSCDVPAGRTVAIVGPTGAGKTTMVKLLMRFYDVDAGAILVDGRDVRDYARGDLRRAFGMVLQDTWLFKGTILENIRYGRPDATDAEVIARGQGRARRCLHPHAARRLSDGAQRGRDERLAGAKAAADHCARRAGERPHPHPRRGDELGRHPHRAAHSGGNGSPHARAHKLCHRAPPEHRPQCRLHSGHARRQHRRAGHARGAACARRVLRGAL